MVTVTTPAQQVVLGDMVVLACAVRGDPRPLISWTLPDGSDASRGGNSIVDTNSGNLTVFSARADNTGTYTCTGTNPIGSNSATTQITVRGQSDHSLVPLGDVLIGTKPPTSELAENFAPSVCPAVIVCHGRGVGVALPLHV